MKKVCFSIVILLSTVSLGQEKINTKISAKNIFDLSIINIYPEKYPDVSVIFQAKNNEGKPLWLLDKSEMSIEENGVKCDITKLINITSKKPLNIGLVFDHSGSMVDNPAQMPKGINTMQENYFAGVPFPLGYKMPIEYAKKGINAFIGQSHESTDSVLFIGFSSEVDKILPLTNNLNEIKSFVNSVEPGGRTAFYDALYESIRLLSFHNSQTAIVAITDGQDNESKHSYTEVIKYAKKKKIPIYIIGLGDVDQYYLNEISSLTNGFFYYTNNPDQLVTIYKNIKEQLRSIYQVDYTSTASYYKSEYASLDFSFLNDTLTFANSEAKFLLPEDAIDYLERKELERLKLIEIKKEEERNNKILLGGIAAAVLIIGIGSFLLIRRKQPRLEIVTIYPNPFDDVLTIKYYVDPTLAKSELIILDINGNVIISQALNSAESEIKIESSDYKTGVYIFNVVSENEKSNSFKAMK